MKNLTGTKQLSRILIKGFKSIDECDFLLGSLNILIGSNGAGKSNFIEFFRLIQQMLERNLQIYVGKHGGPDAILHFGRKTTKSLSAELYFGNNGYKFSLEPTLDNKMMFTKENFWWNKMGRDWDIDRGHFESDVESQKNKTNIYDYVVPVMKGWQIYHFHDTGENSPIKQLNFINDNIYFRPDGSNLAAYLNMLKEKHNDNYNRIVKTIRLVAPYLKDFNLRPSAGNVNMIELEWFEAGHDIPLKAYQFSDGTLRFICLLTLLLQPPMNQPETILIDEPELGLHPYAIKMLAGLLKVSSKEKQIIVSTQSVGLLDEFDAEDIIVVDKTEGKSKFSRVNSEALKEWLDEYSLGELWNKNLLGGRPSK